MKRDPRRRYFTTAPERSRIFSERLEPWLGLLLGLALGLWIAWGLAPRPQLDPSPAALHSTYRDTYRLLIASAYSASGDLERARARLALLRDPDPIQALLEQSRRAAESGKPAQEVLLLAALAEALQQPPTPEAPLPSHTPSPLPTLTTFRLVQQTLLCNPALPAGLVQIQVQSREQQPLVGIIIRASSEAGEQRLSTGLKPERGLGYADFIMQTGLTYYVQVGQGGETAILTPPFCQTTHGELYTGGYLLIFEQR